MKYMKWLMAAFVFAAAHAAGAQTVTLEEHDAEVWLRHQVVEGQVSPSAGTTSGIVHVNESEYAVDITSGTFTATVQLREGENTIVACAAGACSDTVRLTLSYELHPEVYAHADVSGRDVVLRASVIEQPNGEVSSVSWAADADNPTAVSISSASDSVASVVIPDGAPHGEYYFDVVMTDETGAEGRARTFVTAGEHGLTAFDIASDHAAWVDTAVVYEVTPYIFERNGGWSDVAARLDEIAELGINTLWIQPVFEAQMEGPGTAGQGYGIVNYFELREDLGTEEDLRELVRAAKEDFGMRVLFDFVPSHTSIEHPYAQDVLARGASSHYYDFYMTEPDDAPYSQHYHTDREPFVYYFWEDLVIVNWDNPEVYRWMMEAGQKWIEDFGIDGYRIDAVWGVNARSPEAMQQWRFDLKRIKPEIFLLGESPAARSLNFEGRFDAAYDWYADLDWVSHWTWQTDYDPEESLTIFNTWEEWERATLLRSALTNNGLGFHPDAKVFRFMENNDTERFLAWHTLDQTKMAATLLFTLPGIPMIYNGQEIGATDHPYDTDGIFAEGRSVRSLDRFGLYDHYRELINLRMAFPALYSDSFDEVPVSPDFAQDRVFAYRRSHEDMHIIGAVNTNEDAISAELRLPLSRMRIDRSADYYVTDMQTGEWDVVTGSDLQSMTHEIPGFTTNLFVITSERLAYPVASEPDEEIPSRVALAQNYPNPFNPSTTVAFEVPRAGRVELRVFDVLGREVATLIDEELAAGRHTIEFDADRLASGVYLYRLEAGGKMLARRMILSK